jgi:hypothetical protein
MARATLAPLLAALAAATLAGCQSPALVRTARTLPAGGSDLSLSVNVTRVSLREDVIEPSLPLQEVNLPNPIPDVMYDYGISDDFELGGRLSLGSGLIEVRSKLRFLEAARGTLHAAVAPAIGYRVLALVNGPVLTLPLIVTYDLSSGMSLSGGPVISYASYSVPSRFDVGDLDLGGETLYAGGGVGIQFRPAFGLHVMPAVEVGRTHASMVKLEVSARAETSPMLTSEAAAGLNRRAEPLNGATPRHVVPAPENVPPAAVHASGSMMTQSPWSAGRQQAPSSSQRAAAQVVASPL